MGLVNNRAFCPDCGGKIHTRARGLGVLLPFRSGALVQTGGSCQHCGTALSGRVGFDNVAISAATAEDARRHRAELRTAARTGRLPEPTAEDVQRQREIHQRSHERHQRTAAQRLAKTSLDDRLLVLLSAGPVTVRDAAARLDATVLQITNAQTRLGRSLIKASGMGKKRTLRLVDPR